MEDYKKTIEQAWGNKKLLKDKNVQTCIREVIDFLDQGKIRVASPANDEWVVNEWVKKAVILYFSIQETKVTTNSPFAFFDAAGGVQPAGT